MLLLAAAFWLLAALLSMTVLVGFDTQRYVLELWLLLFALACYSGMLILSGKRERIVQTLTAILGAGGVMVLGLVLIAIVFLVLFGQRGVQFAIAAFLIWSLSVKGHIMASALDRKWYFGAILAAAVLAMQMAIGDIFQVQV